ncbi:DUF2178 domain-containing protein [Soehngenia longivitae]|uniref:DUF2178 domain-containing protein n=1 Tax=Soehngenia longivitae TaxID=2562294 RepID=A0A4Z0D5T3_9FIRM|nr:DUF2178 domain-containing protein [Soehngenia longivitae]TFZ40183.1 DUF2178 domain-containing protein [Soehngenia longivitae]
MKNNKKWYLGYLISLVLLIVIFTLDLNRSTQTAVTILFSFVLAITHVNVIHNKMIAKDKEYNILSKDERNEMIRDKVNAMNSVVLISFIGIITVVFIVYEWYIPAIIAGSMIVIDPIIMIFISRFYEKRY